MDRRSFILTSLSAAALSVSALAGCNNATNVTDDAPASDTTTADEAGTGAVDTGTLIVGFDASYPPYGYRDDDGEYTGFDLELAQEVASRNDWEVQLEPIDWDAKDTLLDSGAINCIWNGFTMEGREDDYTFSDMLNAQVIVARAGSGIEDFDGLAGKAVITQVDSAAYNVLAGEDAAQADLAATFASLETIGDYNTAFMQLESGAVLRPARRAPLRGALRRRLQARRRRHRGDGHRDAARHGRGGLRRGALREVRRPGHRLSQLVPGVNQARCSSQ